MDFELEDIFTDCGAIPKRRKKVIGLDDLLSDHHKWQLKLEKKSKQTKAKISYSSDEDEDAHDREAKDLSKHIDDWEDKIGEIGGENEISLWSIQVFGNQKPFPPLTSPDIGSCRLVQNFVNHKINLLVELNIEKGQTFLEEMLVNGWLSKLVCKCGHLEKSIATWTFHLMSYSSSEVLRTSAFNFWRAILSPGNKDFPCMKIDWLPSHAELKEVLKIYGFILDVPCRDASDLEMVHADNRIVGLPQNIRFWIKYVTACCQVRNIYPMYSISEAKELVATVVCLLLDHQIIGLSLTMYKCLISVINFFTEEEWISSYNEVAKSIACRVPKDINSLKAVESISGVGPRGKQLKATLAFQFLKAFFANEELDTEEALRFLIAIDVKDNSCDLLKVYIYLCLMENWLLSNSMLESSPAVQEMWGVYLRNCSCQITSMDMRSYASKVRSKASYLLQEATNEGT